MKRKRPYIPKVLTKEQEMLKVLHAIANTGYGVEEDSAALWMRGLAKAVLRRIGEDAPSSDRDP